MNVLPLCGISLLLIGSIGLEALRVQGDSENKIQNGHQSDQLKDGKVLLAADAPGERPDAKLISASNRFGLKLYGHLLKEGAGKNVLISPTSISLALDMTWNGAAGQTRTAMATALQLDGMSRDAVNKANAGLLADLNSGKKGAVLTAANSLWIGNQAAIKPDFVQRSRQIYHAEIGDLAGAPDNVNAWVSKQTNGKIKTILSVKDVPKGRTAAVLANAVYFKGAWLRPFRPELTKNAPFTRLDGSKTSCAMMSDTGPYRYFAGNSFQAVSLPYGESGASQMRMLLFLPNEDSSLAKLQSDMTEANWNLWTQKLASARGTVDLPRFRFEYETNLKEPLQALGMGIAFDPNHADFSDMSTKPVYISSARHKTFITVDEKGTEAAAATAVSIATRSVPVGKPFHMVFDRPFVCAIQDEATGAILFLGSVVDPLVK